MSMYKTFLCLLVAMRLLDSVIVVVIQILNSGHERGFIFYFD